MPIKYLDLRNFQIKSKPNPTQPYLIWQSCRMWFTCPFHFQTNLAWPILNRI
jgi:hypothetical protein